MPWRRFFARQLDTLVAMVILGVAALLGDPDSLVGPRAGYAVAFGGLAIWTVIEAALLASWGTTPGKAVLGLAVRTSDGSKLSFSTAFVRSLTVWAVGIGFGLPLISVVALALAYRTVKKNGSTWWERKTAPTVSTSRIDTRRIVSPLALAGFCLVAFAVLQALASTRSLALSTAEPTTAVTGGDTESSSVSSPYASVDTLLGLSIGQLLPEVRQEWRAMGIELICSEASSFVSCIPPNAGTDPEGLRLLGFQDGRLVLVSWVLGRDWDAVPFDAVIAQHRAFGPPSRVLDGEGYHALWVSEGIYRQLFCAQRQSWAEGCKITLGVGTLETLEQEFRRD